MSARLSDDQIRAIRAAPGSQGAIADRFGTSQATVSRIKRGLTRPSTEEDTMADEPAVEGGVIVPSPPAEPEQAAELPGGMVNVRCIARNVHLGGGAKLLEGDIGTVTADLAEMLEAKGLARRV